MTSLNFGFTHILIKVPPIDVCTVAAWETRYSKDREKGYDWFNSQG